MTEERSEYHSNIGIRKDFFKKIPIAQGWGSLVGCHLWGHTESDTTEVT